MNGEGQQRARAAARRRASILRAAGWRRLSVLAVLIGMLEAPVVLWAPVSYSSTVMTAAFTGGPGTFTNTSGTLYARNGQALTLTVTTSTDTKCVDVTGDFSGHQQSSTAKSSWTFGFTAGTGDGVPTVTAAASPSFNANNKCTGTSGTQNASFILDNTGPLVTAALNPAPNAAGWNNSNVGVTWSATDNGSGVNGVPSPATDSQMANTSGVTKTATATDRVGNTGSGSVTVRVDKSAPAITGSRTPAANGSGWNNTDVTASFSCSDSPSGIKSCTGPTTLSGSAANQSVTGTAVDNADNSASATVSTINIDKVAPTLTGAPTTSPNAAGWYNGNVTIHWTAGDSLSGLAGSPPGDSTISSEGTGRTASASVSDKAGNTTTATSSPAVNIDKTPPNTTATAPATDWNNTDVTVALNAADALSGVANTFYKLDGGAQQSGTSVQISADGTHSLQFWSVDKAGNAEAAKTVTVKIDKTPPTINHAFDSQPNGNNWFMRDVTVTFSCADSGSGIASCTTPQTVTTEGKDQAVTGTAIDNAGNTATDPATLSIDKTPPAISAAPDRPANANGWYNADVTVGFTCADKLSGIDKCPQPTTLSEGANQSASGTATDAAGNSASDGVSAINVDETAPALSGAATTAPNGNGWYSGDVTVHWTCADKLSGIDGSCPADSPVTGEGGNLSAGATVADKAGNTTATTVDRIKIDRSPPTTSVTVPDALASGWYAGPVNVTLNAADNLSGVDKTFYSVDGGDAQTYAGAFGFNAKGIHTITFWSVDQAGNTEDKGSPGHSITLQIDNVPPSITGTRTPAANGYGWNNTPVAVGFNCTDAESGIASCVGDQTLATDTTADGVNVTGNAQDNAGNTAETQVGPIKIDTVAPTLAGTPTTAANAFGWYRNDVTISWNGQDGLSGIDPASVPANSTITGEGAGLKAGPASVFDKAGNISAATYSAAVNIDRTPPTISGTTVNDDGSARSANAAGWFNSAVRVRFACGDALSGLPADGCPDDVVLDKDGSGLSATGTATDKADNSATATVGGINIDSQPPQTSANNQCDGKNGWCKGNTATVILSATDQAGLSGVKEIHYFVDGGQEKVASGATASVNVPLAAKSGLATVEYFAVDNAGNAEAKSGVSLKYDNIAPSITHMVTPKANAAGWSNANLDVQFAAIDDDLGSGVDAATVKCGAPDASGTPTGGTVTTDPTNSQRFLCDARWGTETSGQTVAAQADDLATNRGTDSETVKLDKTAPTVKGATTTSPNAGGWYNAPVTVKFTCADQGQVQSGIATCTGVVGTTNNGVVLDTNGAGQSVAGTAVDKADNTASATVSGLNIDTGKPAITMQGIADGGMYKLGAVPAASCTAADPLSGVDANGCKVTLSGGLANGVGTYTFTATATDKAGNTQTTTGKYRVIYNVADDVAFWLQPINDTAHTTSTTTSVFKAGSTVPAKFQLKDATGKIVQATSAPVWLTPAKGALTTAAVDESAYSDPADSGTTFRWSATDQAYIYNWGTPKNGAGNYWRIGVTLDDGQTYTVNLGLR